MYLFDIELRFSVFFYLIVSQELMPWDHPYLSGVLRAER